MKFRTVCKVKLKSRAKFGDALGDASVSCLSFSIWPEGCEIYFEIYFVVTLRFVINKLANY